MVANDRNPNPQRGWMYVGSEQTSNLTTTTATTSNPDGIDGVSDDDNDNENENDGLGDHKVCRSNQITETDTSFDTQKRKKRETPSTHPTN